MKKVLSSSLLVIMLFCCSFLLFACGDDKSTIDKSGGYHVVSEEELLEVTNLITSLNENTTNLKFYYNSSKTEAGVKTETNLNGIADYDYNLSFNVNIDVIGTTYSQSAYYSSTENICYEIDYNGNKNKIPLSPKYDILANKAMSTSNMFKLWNEKTYTKNDIQIAKSRGKIKIKVDFTDSAKGEKGEMYFEFLEDGTFVTFAYDSTINKDGIREYLDIDLEATDNIVEPPSDLGSYN